MENNPDFHYTPALIAKERQLMNTISALESMLETVQELRTKVNFERTQLITLIEMVKNKNRGEEYMALKPSEPVRFEDSNNEASKDPLVLLDKLYNGAFCVSEEEEEDEDDEDELHDDDTYITGDNFDIDDDDVQW